MNPEANSQEFEKTKEFEKTIQGDDFDFDFDEDFESETIAEYSVMDAMRFDRQAGTASCNFELDEENEVDPMMAFNVNAVKADAGKGKTKAGESDGKTTTKSKKRG